MLSFRLKGYPCAGKVKSLASAVNPIEGKHLYDIVRMNGYTRTMEVGMANGMSAMYIAQVGRMLLIVVSCYRSCLQPLIFSLSSSHTPSHSHYPRFLGTTTSHQCFQLISRHPFLRSSVPPFLRSSVPPFLRSPVPR